MDTTITFWEPEQKTFYYLNLDTLRSIIAWGYDLPYEQVKQIGDDLSDGEYWCCIDAALAIKGEDIRAELQDEYMLDWNNVLIDLAAQGKIPTGDYLLSVY